MIMILKSNAIFPRFLPLDKISIKHLGRTERGQVPEVPRLEGNNGE
jgi:hypothetical protein